jgi:hypothetical protein
MWGRPNFNMLQFFRSAQTAWTYARYPGSPTRALGRAGLATLSENSFAGAAVLLAEATPLPGSRKNVADFACRAIFNAIDADEVLANASLEEALAVDRGFDSSARAAIAVELASNPLWREIPPRIEMSWKELRAALWSVSDTDWEVWIEWYEDRLAGRPSLGEAFDIAVATLPNELWERGPKVVNARIKELIAEHTPPESIPAQGAGPHFALSADLKITLAPPVEIDAEGNNLDRIRQQLPLVREAAEDLAGRLNPNAFSELARNLSAYRAAIEGEPETIAWGIVFARGVRLDNAAHAARRQIGDRLQPPLEDAAQEALESMLILHGPMILATAEGRELMDVAGQMSLTRGQQAALRSDSLTVAIALRDDKDVIEPPAAEVVIEAVEAMGEGPHPERGSAAGGATIRNVMILAVGIGAVAAIAGVGFVQAGVAVIAVEGLKKSKRFSALTDALGARIDGVLRTGPAFQNFVIKNEQPLRQMASNSPGMRWMLPYIDDIVRRNNSGKSPNQE